MIIPALIFSIICYLLRDSSNSFELIRIITQSVTKKNDVRFVHKLFVSQNWTTSASLSVSPLLWSDIFFMSPWRLMSIQAWTKSTWEATWTRPACLYTGTVPTQTSSVTLTASHHWPRAATSSFQIQSLNERFSHWMNSCIHAWCCQHGEKCIVAGCSNENKDGVSLFKFPKSFYNIQQLLK